jgi:hypothetical protein
MQIIFKTEELTHIAELSEDCTTEEIMEKCTLLAEAASYSPDLVTEGLKKVLELRLTYL